MGRFAYLVWRIFRKQLNLDSDANTRGVHFPV
jgi:hypothetical protein